MLRTDLWHTITSTQVEAGSVAVWWLGQAGFVVRSPAGAIVLIDAYLSDCAESAGTFRRLMAALIDPAEIDRGLVISTHEHADHLDIGAIPAIARQPATRFAGPAACVGYYRELGLAEERFDALAPGTVLRFEDVVVRGLPADHGELAPDAIGVVLELAGLTIYHSGDTAFSPERLAPAAGLAPDLALPCINGAYGNMDPTTAAQFVAFTGARLAIPTHFWMFAEQDGDPAAFLAACRQLAPAAQTMLLTPGETYVFRK